jgi:hypothetical protein
MSEQQFTMDDIKDHIRTLILTIDSMNEKIAMLGTIQSLVTETLAKDNPDFMRKMMSTVLAHDGFRDDFTEFLNEKGAPDEIKLFMMAMNEHLRERQEEE